MKQLFGETMKGQIDRFVSIDGAGSVSGQRRRGQPSLSRDVQGAGRPQLRRVRYREPDSGDGTRDREDRAAPGAAKQPKTTFNVGRVGGGTSVNAIPSECWMEVDLRSSDPRGAGGARRQLQNAVDAAVSEENAAVGRRGASITVVKELVGDRPAGRRRELPDRADRACRRAALGIVDLPASRAPPTPTCRLQLGIPAITIGGGGRGADAHTPAETFDTTDAWRGTQYAVLLTIALARP